MGRMLSSIRNDRWVAPFVVSAAACLIAGQVFAADCPGHPNALGTSRTLVVDPREHPRIGTMQYSETLPLADHEVVLTFDDGPLPRYSNQILDILASQCVRATFFTVGRMAQTSLEGVRKLRDAGHTIGTHTQDHPYGMKRMSLERAKPEIDNGIASVRAALGDDADSALAPFFRIPGLSRTYEVEDYLASKGIQIWSADFLADDWRHVSPSRVYDLAIKRLEAKGKGILLLHDIQPRTVAALPRILDTLKARGYRVVHVVPATPERPATPTEAQQWLMHPPADAIAHWPQDLNFVFTHLDSLPATARSDFEEAQALSVQNSASWLRPSWPEPFELAPNDSTVSLAVPGPTLFELQGGLEVALRGAALSHRAKRLAANARETDTSQVSRHELRHVANRRQVRVAHRGGQSHREVLSKRKNSPTGTPHRTPTKRLVQVKRTNV